MRIIGIGPGVYIGGGGGGACPQAPLFHPFKYSKVSHTTLTERHDVSVNMFHSKFPEPLL